MKLLDIAQSVVEEAVSKGATQAEASVYIADNDLARYTRNRIHQNVSTKNYYLNLDLVVGDKKLGSSAINSIEEDDLGTVVDRALKIAEVSTPDPDFESLPTPERIAPLKGIYKEETAKLSPEEIADGIKLAIDTAMDYDDGVKWSAGAFSRDVLNIAIANSLGVEAETRYTQASMEVNTKAGEDVGEGSGFAVERSKDVDTFDFEELALSAARDAVNSINPKTIPTGDYEAILKPEAVSTFTMFLGMLGFSARANQEGYSFIGDKLGSGVFDESLTILDNGRDVSTLNASPFDGEGVPKRALMLVNGGVAENLCYDTYHALKVDEESTGHALPKLGGAWYGDFPLPINQIVEPGDAGLDEMIEETDRGVLITRLHYVNPIKRDKGIISGMTRDGTWYIEDGEVKHPVKVMRFTDSIIRVLTDIVSIGNESTVKTLPYATSPAIHASRFKFTGQSEF